MKTKTLKTKKQPLNGLGARMRQALNNELIEAKQTDKGRGLFARVYFNPGQLICGVKGSLMLDSGTSSRGVMIGSEAHRFSLQNPWADRYWATGPGNLQVVPDLNVVGWHLSNHSCRPNAVLRTAHGEGLRALRSIKAGEEVTCWYGWKRSEAECLCGEEHCSGWIGLPLRDADEAEGHYRRSDLIKVLRVGVANGNKYAISLVAESMRECGASQDTIDRLALEAIGPNWEAIIQRVERAA